MTILPDRKVEVYRNLTRMFDIIMWPCGCLVIEVLLKQTYTRIPKSENDVRLRAKLDSMNHTGLPV